MVRINIMAPQDVVIVRGHPSTKKHNFLRKVPSTADNPTIAQAEARLEFSRFMAGQYGQTGTVTLPDGRRISRTAYNAMAGYGRKGVGAFGGLSEQQRAAEKHALAGASINKQEARLARLRGGARGASTAVGAYCPPGTML